MSYKKLKSPLSVQIEMTEICNNNCKHCYNYWRDQGKTGNNLSILNEKQIIFILEQIKKHEVHSVLFTGGEPLLVPNSLIKGIEYCVDNDISCSINSNLVSIPKKIVPVLKKHNIHVLTSLLSYNKDTHDRITGKEHSFVKTTRNVKFLKKEDIKVGINMVVMKDNLEHVLKTGRFAFEELKIDSFNATKVHPTQNNPNFTKIQLDTQDIEKMFNSLIVLNKEFGKRTDSLTSYPNCMFEFPEKYYDFLIKRSCSAGKTGCTISSSGEIRPCGHSDMIYGNIFSNGLIESWEKMDEWRNGSILPDYCKKCENLAKCGAGCRMDAKYFKNIKSPDCYMDIDNNTRLFFSKKNKKETILLLDDDKLFLSLNLKFRHENFGIIVLLNNKMKTIMTNDSFSLLKQLTTKKGWFSIKEVLFSFDNVAEEELRKFLTSLLKIKIIERRCG